MQEQDVDMICLKRAQAVFHVGWIEMPSAMLGRQRAPKRLPEPWRKGKHALRGRVREFPRGCDPRRANSGFGRKHDAIAPPSQKRADDGFRFAIAV